MNVTEGPPRSISSDDWRSAFATLAKRMGARAVAGLLGALLRDDERLVRGVTVVPPCMDWRDDSPLRQTPCQAGCLVTVAGWLGGGITTVGGLDDWFAAIIKGDGTDGGSDAVQPVIWFYDATPRDEMRAALIPECRLALARMGEDSIRQAVPA